ncbi:unnamed protein product [Microthlaspi erraticum]|uniref:FBD domain-containing protein n=1 Tax=Microthlaspi erraticum TaxID=1685480 RepID=A0A6D2I447_9BRAS|nr:unnamed protein product [Microthlaspi erraticum]
MNGIQNVHRLDLMLILSRCSGQEGRGWQAMPALLRNCPRLETIIIRGLIHDVTDKCGDACPCISREDRGLSLKSCPVNRLEIQEFRGTMKEMVIIKHFLDFLPSLKRFDVFVEDDEPTQLRNAELSNCVVEMFALYGKLFPSAKSSSCLVISWRRSERTRTYLKTKTYAIVLPWNAKPESVSIVFALFDFVVLFCLVGI